MVELKPFMRPAGEDMGKEEQWLAFYALSKHIRHAIRDSRALAHADARTRQTTLYAVTNQEIAALTQAPARPDKSDRWVFIIDAVTQAVYRYRANVAEQHVYRVALDLDFSMQLDDAIHAPRVEENIGFLQSVGANIDLDVEHGTNFTPVGQPEIRGLIEHLGGFTPVSLGEAIIWRPS